MSDEIKFECDVCHKRFDATPDAFVECGAEFRAVDPETQETIELDDKTRAEIYKEAAQDPEIGPFMKGAACICIECQDRLLAEADEIIPGGESPS